MKRAFDAIAAGIAMVVLSPVLAAVAVLVRLRLGTPVLFRQARTGLDERPFTIIKFRTMTDARGEDGRLLPDEDRLTSLGRLLRSTSLDELPELWNVVRGDMSLVGPRPLPVQYLSRMTESERRRHTVRPGITGSAQVGGRNLLDWESRLGLDVWYVEHRSFTIDLKLLARTFGAVWHRHGINAIDAATMHELRPELDDGERR